MHILFGGPLMLGLAALIETVTGQTIGELFTV